MRKTQRLAFTALLTAIALGIFVLEAQIPVPIPVPGVKLGLANVVTLTAMMLMGRKEAGVVLFLRLIMGAMFAGSPASFIYSAAGGFLAYLIMCLLIHVFPEKYVWIVSAIAAVGHNLGQLLACVVIVQTPGVLAYLPILAASGVITGVFTGFVARYLTAALRKVKFFN